MKSCDYIKQDEELLTQLEAAKVLKLSPRSLGRLKGLKVVRLNQRILRYRRTDLEEWLDANTIGQCQPILEKGLPLKS